MELENTYENAKELIECQRGRAGDNGESLKPECHVQPMELGQRNLSLRVIYVLLGVCIFLSVVAIITAVMLTIKNSEQTLSSIAKIQDEISQLSKNTATSIAGVKNELSQWKSNVAENFRKTGSSITKLQNDILQRSDNLLRCPTEWTRFRKSCFHFSSSSKTWVEAQRHCASVDAHLVVINNAEEQDFLRRNLQNRYWIGLSDAASEGDWRWVDGTDYSSSSLNWMEGEPNDDKNAEDCAEILVGGKWNDLACDESQQWICERSALIPP
ncbi:CD209 antigen-like protein C isoform X2 [Hemitrygon akajei]|uniref:CD209 antigen-like protein C isoform X2 n=1 Tax=Hemitrygon akajei TaxID=2704970 RepID=UPI003BF967D7